MAASMKSRRFFEIMMLLLVVSWGHGAPDKLSPRQKAPEYARSSGGRALAPPKVGQTPANTGRLNGAGPPSGAQQNSLPQDDNAQREESTSFKEVNGSSVMVVTGSLKYQSPEGLPVSVSYTADENGNKASFTIGAAAGGGTGSKPSTGIQPPNGGNRGGNAPKGGPGSGNSGAGNKGPGGGNKGPGGRPGQGGLPGNEDRKYLPPS